MASLLDQLPALLGVVVGAAGSFVATSLTERARWRRQLDSRWDEERRKAYSEYALAVKSLIQQCGRLATTRGIESSRFTKVDLDDGMGEFLRLSADRAVKWEAVLLLGDAATIAAGREWHTIVFKLDKFAQGFESDPDQWSTEYMAAGDARDRFYECARRDLEIIDRC